METTIFAVVCGLGSWYCFGLAAWIKYFRSQPEYTGDNADGYAEVVLAVYTSGAGPLGYILCWWFNRDINKIRNMK